MHSTIKFTAEISATKADFLDTTVYMNDDGSLWTDLFCKPTDTHSYLRYESSHPPHCKRSLPYSQFLRLRRICSREEDFTKHAKNMKSLTLWRRCNYSVGKHFSPPKPPPPRLLSRLVKKLQSTQLQLTILLNKISVRSLTLTGIYLVPLEPKNCLKLGSSLGTAGQRTSGNILFVQP